MKTIRIGRLVIAWGSSRVETFMITQILDNFAWLNKKWINIMATINGEYHFAKNPPKGAERKKRGSDANKV